MNLNEVNKKIINDLGYEVAEGDWSNEQLIELLNATVLLTQEDFKEAGFTSKMSPEEIRDLSIGLCAEKEMPSLFGRA